MRLMSIRVIGNFGLDFKQFIQREEVLEKLVEIVKGDKFTEVERRDALTALKNLQFEASEADQARLEKVVTCEFLLEVIKNK